MKERVPQIVDPDRGYMMRDHGRLGINIYMYVDDPGVYMTYHGHTVPEQLAKEAGFEVDRFAKERLRRERMAAAAKAIEAELADGGVVEEVVAEKGDFKMIHIGLGRYQIVDKDKQVLTEAPLTKELAEGLLDSLADAVQGGA